MYGVYLSRIVFNTSLSICYFHEYNYTFLSQIENKR